MIVCPHLLGELEDVLHRAKLRRWFSENDAAEFIADLSGVADSYPDPTTRPPSAETPTTTTCSRFRSMPTPISS
jgi:hypothetical protein